MPYVICRNGGGQFHLSDVNFDLINTYQVIKRDPGPLISKLRQHAAKHSKDYYYKIRSQHHLDDRVEIAARFIYLNKTCYNGLWRVNSKGEFNVPIGSYKNPVICDETALRACHIVLQGIDVRMRDFRELQAGRGDFVYFDPPYQPLDKTSFTRYAKADFGPREQEALRDLCLALHDRGAKFMLSNSDTSSTLYDNPIFRIEIVKAPRFVNSKASGRGAVNELLIRNY
ncbi:MAG: Dam family site-specific DNA-(adenine-N6)-methyltransferase [Chloroflexota bacterium]|nr:Dam family site-specific DNA-(adenine-N6)-methyltransferase [Chloroflexota bacterium]